MAFFTTDDGTKLYYEELGKGEKTIVFVHGIMDSHASFKEQASWLADKYKIVVYDQRAHGQSDVPAGGYTMARLAQDLHGLIEYLHLEHIILVGYSMGVHVVYDYIEQFGENGIDLFVLSVMSPRLVSDDEYHLGLGGKFTQEDVEKTIGSLQKYFGLLRLLGVAGYKGDKKYKKQVAPYYKRTKKLKKEPMILLNIELAKGDYWATLDKISKPTLVIAGANDIYPTATHEAVHARLKTSRLVIIPDAGHMVLLERPEEWRKGFDDFATSYGG
jgi:pimeloyl-ACP methyl ester carboxylesterase